MKCIISKNQEASRSNKSLNDDVNDGHQDGICVPNKNRVSDVFDSISDIVHGMNVYGEIDSDALKNMRNKK